MHPTGSHSRGSQHALREEQSKHTASTPQPRSVLLSCGNAPRMYDVAADEGMHSDSMGYRCVA